MQDVCARMHVLCFLLVLQCEHFGVILFSLYLFLMHFNNVVDSCCDGHWLVNMDSIRFASIQNHILLACSSVVCYLAILVS